MDPQQEMEVFWSLFTKLNFPSHLFFLFASQGMKIWSIFPSLLWMLLLLLSYPHPFSLFLPPNRRFEIFHSSSPFSSFTIFNPHNFYIIIRQDWWPFFMVGGRSLCMCMGNEAIFTFKIHYHITTSTGSSIFDNESLISFHFILLSNFSGSFFSLPSESLWIQKVERNLIWDSKFQ